MSQQEDDCLTALLLTDLDTHFRQLVESYQHSLYRVMYRQVGCEQDAEDLVQETFVRAYYALRDYATQGRRLQSVRPWLYKIAFHLYYNRIRTTRPLMFPLDLSGEPALLDLEHPDPGPEELVARSECVREVTEVISSLPERYKVVLNLYYFAELR
jgi:RNA polymerase sigma-70 factor (ECF subfamily)